MNRIRALPIAVLAVALLAGCSSTVTPKHASSASTTKPAPSTTPPDISTESGVNPTPEVFPSPDGTYEGSCDYELSDDMNNYPAHAGDLNGEVDVTNTGNVGTVEKVTISWPQLGHPPIKLSKTVRVGYGQTKTVPFTRPASGSEIDRLQSYQGSHDDNGCKYSATLTDTFGKVHSP
jgi:hypothetical protein